MKSARKVIEDGREVRLHRQFRVAIVGAGISGIAAAYTLKNAGINDITIFEKAQTVGGTWRDHRFPGVACDVPSHLYSFTFALNSEWSSIYPPGEEIHAYLEDVTDRFDLRKFMKFGVEITACNYRDGGWEVVASDGVKETFDILIPCTGLLHIFNRPQIDGLDDFAGDIIYSARWNSDVDLDGKRVGHIGVGSSSVQIVPNIVDKVEKLSVFQRSAHWVIPLGNEEFPDEARAGMRGRSDLLAERYDQLLHDMHTDFGGFTLGDPEIKEQFLQACQGYIDSVEDEELREKLQPQYELGCKRLVVSNSYYDALQKDNCTLVTTPIERIESDGVRTSDGVLHSVDAVILATGYDSKAYFRSINPVGEGGVTLDEVWQNGVTSFETVTLAGFPNLFMIAGPLSALGNQPFITSAELQCTYIVRLLKLLEEQEADAIVPKLESQERFYRENEASADGKAWLSGCQSWYLDSSGRFQFYAGPLDRYVDIFARGPLLEDFELRFCKHALAADQKVPDMADSG